MQFRPVLPTVTEQSNRSVKRQPDAQCQCLNDVGDEAATVDKAISKNLAVVVSNEFPPNKSARGPTLPSSPSRSFQNLQSNIKVPVPPL